MCSKQVLTRLKILASAFEWRLMRVQGTILALASRPQKGAQMQLSDSLELSPKRGVFEDYSKHRNRQISFLDVTAWDTVCLELGTKLPWYFRRANVLVEGLNFQELKGKTVHIGDSVIKIQGEVTPCHVMDSIHSGLKSALVNEWRGGAYGKVLSSGSIHVGDKIIVD